ncbi:MAG: ferritin-like domain-containing protein [Candidatus Binatia bacterium]
MAADPRMVEMMSYYRDAELQGAALLLRLIKLMDDADAQVKLSLHLSEETHHAWLWTNRIKEIGGEPMKVLDGYQKRIGLRTVPKTLIDLLALTVVVEERSFARYQEHAARPETDAKTLAVLKEVTKDEKWHIAWIRQKLMEMAAEDGGVERANDAIEKYRKIDAAVYAELQAKEQELFGRPAAAATS